MRAGFIPLLLTVIPNGKLDSYVRNAPVHVMDPPCLQVGDLVNLAEAADASEEFANCTSQYTMM